MNAAEVVVTDAVFGNASPLMEPTREKARARLLPLLEQGMLPVMTGFNGATADGRPTTLGRGGSDFSASILAAALDASELWIWTDVDGIMSADPRLVPDAEVLDEITYAEAAELAYNGAKVLHPRTLAPLVEKRIPVWSKNSFAPEKPGTQDRSGQLRGHAAPRAVTSMANVALVSLEPASPELNGVQVMARALDAMARANVEVLVLSSSSYRQNFCFLVREEELERAIGGAGSGAGAGVGARLREAAARGRERGPAGGGGRRHAGKAGPGGPHLHGDFARAGERDRHRARVQRADHRHGGAPRRVGEGRAGGARRVRAGEAGVGGGGLRQGGLEEAMKTSVLEVDPKRYGRLLARKLPAVIRTEEENERLIAELEQFDKRHDELTPEEREYSELLTVLIEAFEDANYALEGSTSDSRLRSLMEEHGLRQRDLLDVFGSRGIASEVAAFHERSPRRLATFRLTPTCRPRPASALVAIPRWPMT